MVICIDFLTICSQEHRYFLSFYFWIFICKALNIVKKQQRQLKMNLDFIVSAYFKDYRMPKKKKDNLYSSIFSETPLIYS